MEPRLWTLHSLSRKVRLSFYPMQSQNHAPFSPLLQKNEFLLTFWVEPFILSIRKILYFYNNILHLYYTDRVRIDVSCPCISLKLRPCPRSRFANCKVNAWSSKFAMSMTTSRITAPRWRKRGSPRRISTASRTSISFPFSPRATCGTPILMAFWPLLCKIASVSSPPPGPQAGAWWHSIPSTMWTSGRIAAPGPLWPLAAPQRMWSMSPMAMVCSPAVPACMAAPTRWAA